MVYVVQAPTHTRTGKYKIDEKGDLRAIPLQKQFLGSEAYDLSTGKTFHLTGLTFADWVEAASSALTYDLTESETGCTVTTQVAGSTVAPGTGALTSGDVITVTVEAATHYHTPEVTCNDVLVTSPYTAMIKEDIVLVGTAVIDTFDLAVTSPENGSITTVVGDTPVEPGTDVLEYGDSLTITLVPDTGYDIATLTLNDEAFTSGEAHEVIADVALAGTVALKTYDLTVTATDCTVTVLNGETPVEAGTGVLSHFDVLTISVVPGDEKTMSVFTVNTEAFTSGEDHEVAGAVTIVATATA